MLQDDSVTFVTQRWGAFFHVELRRRIRPKLVAYSAMWNIIDTQRRTEVTRCGITAVDAVDSKWFKMVQDCFK